MPSFQGKSVAITGGASGIGLEVAKELAKAGANVSICDIRQDSLDAASKILKDLAGKDFHFIASQVDIRKPDQVESWIQQTVDDFGSLDATANVAGAVDKNIGVDLLQDQDDEQFKFVFDVNVTGMMHCMRAELKHMREGGSIVNMASLAGVLGAPGSACYSASKHAVVGLTRSAAKEVGKRGIRVNAVAPGYIVTQMAAILARNMNLPSEIGTASVSALGRAGRPEEVANLVVFLMSDKSSYMTGNVVPIDGGLWC